jgi:catechol 2,3-dioxygenase-like lactoylglutathione lyase family enzyme
LLVADVGGSVRFYRDVLGPRLNWEDETTRSAGAVA